MDKENTMEILNEIRDYRNRELSNLKDNRVFYTITMSLGEGQKSKKEIFRIIEEYSTGYNKSEVRELFYEYDEKEGIKEIAKLDPKISDFILSSIDPALMNEEEQKNWQLIMEDIVEGRNKNIEKLHEAALKLGMKEEETKKLKEIDLYKKIDEKQKESEKDKEKVIDEKDEEIEISKENAQKRGIIGMNTISLNQKVGTHGETLKSELGLDQYKEYSDVIELEIVPSYKLAYLGEKVHNISFVAVGKRSNGEIVVFPKSVSRPYTGNNNEIINHDGAEDNVTKEKSDCMIIFKNGKSLSIDQKSPYGIVDGSLVYNTRDNDGRIALDLQNKLEDGTKQQDVETRDIVNGYHGEYHANEITTEAREHSNEEFEQGEVKKEDADGKEGGSHIHINENEFKKAVDDIMKYLKLEREESRVEVTNALLAKIVEKEGTTKNILEEAKKDVKEELSEQVENQYRGGNTNI